MPSEPDKVFFEELFNTRPSLWPAILNCNAHPCPQATLLANLPPNLEEPLKIYLSSGKNSLREAQEQVEVNFFWDFKEDAYKLALLDDLHLTSLAKLSGVTLHAKELAMLITRKQREACLAYLSPDLFDYALLRGQYRVGQAGKIMARRDLDLELGERCLKHGWLALLLLSQPWPESLKQIFNQRLSKLAPFPDLNQNSQETLDKSEQQALWLMLKKCLLREVQPAWTPFFNA